MISERKFNINYTTIRAEGTLRSLLPQTLSRRPKSSEHRGGRW